jgi:hypothetical protein
MDHEPGVPGALDARTGHRGLGSRSPLGAPLLHVSVHLSVCLSLESVALCALSDPRSASASGR